jgi:DNA-directed RNA polymerase specialized sigma24 family protein
MASPPARSASALAADVARHLRQAGVVPSPDKVKKIARGAAGSSRPTHYIVAAAHHAAITAWRREMAGQRRAERERQEAELQRTVADAQKREAALVARLVVEAKGIARAAVSPQVVEAAISVVLRDAGYAKLMRAEGISPDNAYQRVRRGVLELYRAGSPAMRSWLEDRGYRLPGRDRGHDPPDMGRWSW